MINGSHLSGDMDANTDPMFLDFRRPFEAGAEDADGQELALISLDTILRDPVHCRHRIALLDSVARACAGDALEMCRTGLHRWYYDRERRLDPSEVELLDRLSRNPIALREVHRKVAPQPEVHLTEAFPPKPRSDFRPTIKKAIMFAAAACACIAVGLWHHRTVEAVMRERDSYAADVKRLQAQLAEFKSPASSRPEDVFQKVLGELFEVHISETNTDSIVIVPNSALPQWFEKAEVYWEHDPSRAERPEVFYYFRSTPLAPSISHRLEAGEDPRLVRSVLRFYPNEQAKSLLPELDRKYVERSFTVMATKEGVTLIRDPALNGTKWQLELPYDPVPSSQRLTAELIATTAEPQRDERQRTAATVHILVRSIGGSGPWQEHLTVLPDRFPLAAMKPGISSFRISVSSAASLLGLPADPIADGAISDSEQLPTEFEFLVVELPGPVWGWSIPADRLDVDNPAAEGTVVRARQRVTIEWPESPFAADLPAKTLPRAS